MTSVAFSPDGKTLAAGLRRRRRRQRGGAVGRGRSGAAGRRSARHEGGRTFRAWPSAPTARPSRPDTAAAAAAGWCCGTWISNPGSESPAGSPTGTSPGRNCVSISPKAPVSADLPRTAHPAAVSSNGLGAGPAIGVKGLGRPKGDKGARKETKVPGTVYEQKKQKGWLGPVFWSLDRTSGSRRRGGVRAISSSEPANGRPSLSESVMLMDFVALSSPIMIAAASRPPSRAGPE